MQCRGLYRSCRCLCGDQNFVPPMSNNNPITHLAIKFPAPICEGCDQVMLTVTEVYSRRHSESLKLVSYKCQRCGSTLGKLQQRLNRSVQ
jgi:RNase P subunit RPR2